MSLRNGATLGVTTGFLINPNNLKVEGFFCHARDAKKHEEAILLTQDVRDFVPQGIAVNDFDALSNPEDLVRLKQYIDLRYDPVGKKVVTLTKDNLGKVSDFAVDEQSFYIQKLYATPSILSSLSGGSLSIDRSQINEITDKKIIVKDISAKIPSGAPAVA
ncbi:MAG: hypothetical protein WBP26_04805 [Candidatus Saccharimonadales bacterium]